MSARSKAARYLMAGRPMTHDEAEAMLQGALDEHAHELAERLRARSMEIAGYDDAYRHAADFIDPEVD